MNNKYLIISILSFLVTVTNGQSQISNDSLNVNTIKMEFAPESTALTLISGHVISIIDAKTVMVLKHDSTKIKYKLAMIDFPVDDSIAISNCKQFLIDSVLNKDVQIGFNGSDRNTEEVEAIIETIVKDGVKNNVCEINRYLLKNGYVVYKEPKSNKFGWSIPDFYQELEKRAILNKIGIWKKAK